MVAPKEFLCWTSHPIGADDGLHRVSSSYPEIFLEHAPAAQVIAILKERYKNVRFIPHPTRNSFYVVGRRSDILQIKSDVPHLDLDPNRPPEVIQRESIQVKFADIQEVQSLLATLVPDATISILAPDVLVVEGTAAALETTKKLMEQIDRPLETVRVECKALQVSPQEMDSLGISWSSNAPAHYTLPPTLRTLGLAYWPGRHRFDLDPGQFVGFPAPPPAQEVNFQVGMIRGIPSFNLTKFSGPQFTVRSSTKSGKEAQLLTGDRMPLTYFNPHTQKFEEQLDLGITVNITPSVKSDGYIVLKLHFQVSTLAGMRNHIPLTLSFNTVTDARVKDGEMLFFRGLLSPEDQRNMTSTPWLQGFGDAPAELLLVITSTVDQSNETE